jgi:hypothetical protein
VKLAIWSALPPSPSPIAEIVAASLPALARAFEIEVVCPEPGRVDADLRRQFSVCAPGQERQPDLDVYHLDNSAELAHAYRASRVRPGVVVLHEPNLHDAFRRETTAAEYRREMRRAYREAGSVAGRQIARGYSSEMLQGLFPLDERLLAGSLGAVVLTRRHAVRAQQWMPGRPVLHWPTPLAPLAAPTRDAARSALGIAPDAFVISVPGPATPDATAARVLAHFAADRPNVRLLTDSPHAINPLVGADAVLVLRLRPGVHDARVALRAMALGRPVLVTAGTDLAEDMPEGTVVPLDAGPYQDAELHALLERLMSDRSLRERIGQLARTHVAATHDASRATASLVEFLRRVHAEAHDLSRAARASDRPLNTLLAYLQDEVGWTARDLGLPDLPPGVRERVAELVASQPSDGAPSR